MYNVFNRSAPIMVGVDVSSTSVKLLELSRDGERYRVESFAVVPVPAGVVVEKNIKDPEALSEVMKKAVLRSGTTAKYACVAVYDASVITRIVQMEKSLSEAEVELQIAVEADKYIPYPLDEVRLDFDILHPSATNPDQMDVLLVASHSANVETRVRVVGDAGLTVRVVDVESYAMERACHLIADTLPNKGVNEAIAVIDIGSIMTSLTVLYDMSTVFSRCEVFGGEHLTKAIQRHYGLSYAEAGLAKKTGDLPDDYVTEVLAAFKESAVLQVRRSLQFFYSASQHNKISHIVLAGGSVNIPGFAQLLEDQIGIPTSIANPFHNMTISSRVNVEALTKDASALMICCGLALRSFD